MSKNTEKKILVGTVKYLDRLLREYGNEALVSDVIDAELKK